MDTCPEGRAAHGKAEARRNRWTPAFAAAVAGEIHALPVDSVRLSRAGSARARGEDGCVGTFQTGGWSVHAERRQVAENRLCSVGFQGVRLLGMAVEAHDLVALFDESCGEAGADAAGHPDREARDRGPSSRWLTISVVSGWVSVDGLDGDVDRAVVLLEGIGPRVDFAEDDDAGVGDGLAVVVIEDGDAGTG